MSVSPQMMQQMLAQQTAPQTGLIGSEQALQGGLTSGINALQQGFNTARGDLAPFSQGGAGAASIQAALTGASGPDAQRAAFANFQQDPGTQFLQQQGEQAILRNQAALGGLGGGNVRRALTRFGQDLASQGLQQRLQNLGGIAGQGLQAAGQQAGIAQTGGQNVANLLTGTAQDVASGRLQTGRDIASNIGGTTSALSNLINQQGTGLSGQIGTAGTNLANILQGTGSDIAGGQGDLASLLAGIAGSEISGVSGLPSSAALLNNTGILGPLAQLASGVGTAAQGFSDERLKTNIVKTGETPSGINLYTWDWTEEAKQMVGDQPSFGVMAQEIMNIIPHAVIMHEDGYYRVDYTRVH